MSKIAKNIKMLDILSSGNKYNCNQLSKILEVSPREIRKYKEELEKNGVYIDSYYGSDGGYKLRSKLELPSILFTGYDLEKLEAYIKENSSCKNIGDIIEIKDKIAEFCRLLEKDTLVIDNEVLHIYKIIEKAIINKKSLMIEYESKGELKKRKVIPKQIYVYEKNIFFVVQYSEDPNDIRHLNINRIKNINVA